MDDKLSHVALQVNNILRNHKRYEHVAYSDIKVKKLVDLAIDKIDKYTKNYEELKAQHGNEIATPDQFAATLYNFLYNIIDTL